MATYKIRITLQHHQERFLRNIKETHGLSYNEAICALIDGGKEAFCQNRKAVNQRNEEHPIGS